MRDLRRLNSSRLPYSQSTPTRVALPVGVVFGGSVGLIGGDVTTGGETGAGPMIGGTVGAGVTTPGGN